MVFHSYAYLSDDELDDVLREDLLELRLMVESNQKVSPETFRQAMDLMDDLVRAGRSFLLIPHLKHLLMTAVHQDLPREMREAHRSWFNSLLENQELGAARDEWIDQARKQGESPHNFVLRAFHEGAGPRSFL